MKKKLLLFLIFANLILQAQTSKWSDLFSYNNVKVIREDGDRLIAATENGIFYYYPGTGEIKKLSKESLSIIEKYLKLTKKCNYKIINDNLVFEDEICNLEFLSLSVTFLSYEINESRYKKSIENINYRILD